MLGAAAAAIALLSPSKASLCAVVPDADDGTPYRPFPCQASVTFGASQLHSFFQLSARKTFACGGDNDAKGQMILAQRGVCSFVTKAVAALDSNASALIVADSTEQNAPPMQMKHVPSEQALTETLRNFPVVSVLKNDADWLIENCASCVVMLVIEPDIDVLFSKYEQMSLPAYGMLMVDAVLRNSGSAPATDSEPFSLSAEQVIQTQMQVAFLLANRYDALGLYEDAWPLYRKMNDLLLTLHNDSVWTYNLALRFQALEQISSIYTPQATLPLLKTKKRISWSADGSNGLRIVLITGLPRTGTSLIEQILHRHPRVYAHGEVDYLAEVTSRFCGDNYTAPSLSPADCLAKLKVADAAKLEATADELKKLLTPPQDHTSSYSVVTTKTPTDFEFAPVLAALLSADEFRIIGLQRDVRDTELSMYFKNFIHGTWMKTLASNLEWIRRYHALYSQTIEHYKDQLHIPMLTVQYEDMVQHQETETRRLLDYIGLDWHPDVLTFYESKRVVETASKHQVRKRMYNTSIGRHRHYPQARSDSIDRSESRLSVRGDASRRSKVLLKTGICALIPESLEHASAKCLERGLCFWNVDESKLEAVVMRSLQKRLYQFPCQPAQSFGSRSALIPAVEIISAPESDPLLCNEGTHSELDLRGRFVLVRRGNCSFGTKSRNARKHGAAGLLIADTEEKDETMAMRHLPTEGNIVDSLSDFPVFSILRSDGDHLISKCAHENMICSMAVLIASSAEDLLTQLATGKVTKSYYLHEFVKKALDASSVIDSDTGDAELDLGRLPGVLNARKRTPLPETCEGPETECSPTNAHHADVISKMTAKQRLEEIIQAQYRMGVKMDKLGFHEKAWVHFQTMNALVLQLMNGTSAVVEVHETLTGLSRIRNAYPKHSFDKLMARKETADKRNTPLPLVVMILGMPRTGSSLLEQILARHPQVHAHGEILNLHHLALRLCSGTDKDRHSRSEGMHYHTDPAGCLRHLQQKSPHELGKIGRGFRESLVVNDTYTVVTTKSPADFEWLPVVAAILQLGNGPGIDSAEARIVLTQRHQRDSEISMLMQNFEGAGRVLASSIPLLRRYHALYSQTIEHYKDQLHIPMLTVQYEDMVQHQETETRRLLDYIGLDWHPDVLTFYESKRVVETASKHQVRKRMYNTSIGRHRHYPQTEQPERQIPGVRVQPLESDAKRGCIVYQTAHSKQ